MGKLHTPEPWGFDGLGGNPDAWRIFGDGRVILWIDGFYESQEANARRIVACDMQAELLKAWKQLDELLAALGVAQATFNCAGMDTPAIVASTVEKYADAIASVKGETK